MIILQCFSLKNLSRYIRYPWDNKNSDGTFNHNIADRFINDLINRLAVKFQPRLKFYRKVFGQIVVNLRFTTSPIYISKYYLYVSLI